jgi:CDP-paratose 2-epimerase
MSPHILITGGVGFIGTNAAIFFATRGYTVTIVDDFSRPGVDRNASYLHRHYPRILIIQTDVRSTENYIKQLKTTDVVLHLAGQTAVTTSLVSPTHDFEANVHATFTLLEAVRHHAPHAFFIYASTNKVYGNLRGHTLTQHPTTHAWQDTDFPAGIDESCQLDFLSPYGVSKGAADQYVKDWYHSFGLRTCVFRQSCIYGPYQMGVEDQGWVAFFAKQLLARLPITIYGDGYQVRDLLHVHDLLDAYERAIKRQAACAGRVMNIGGGVTNAYSLHQVLLLLEQKTDITPRVTYAPERLADQKYFVSANTTAKALLDWSPSIGFPEGVETLLTWLKQTYHR